ncbi:MAG: porin family protein [Pseudomonadota bacterium]
MKKHVLVALTAMFVSTAPAFAEEKKDFEGFKATALIGYDNGDFGEFVTIDGVSIDLNNAEGLFYGLNIGYDRQTGRLVYGIELEATDSAADLSDTILGQVELGRDLYAGGRLGYAVSNKSMIYAKAGYTDARLRTVGFQSIGDDGFRLGAGAEHRFGKSFFARAEYRFSEYGRGIRRHQGLIGMGIQF